MEKKRNKNKNDKKIKGWKKKYNKYDNKNKKTNWDSNTNKQKAQKELKLGQIQLRLGLGFKSIKIWYIDS